MTGFDDFPEERVQHAGVRAGRERIMEIIVFLLAEMRANKQLAEIDLKPLSMRGFSENEISTAFSWLLDKISMSGLSNDNPLVFSAPFEKRSLLDPTKAPEQIGFRVYHEIERSVLSKEAQGYLLQMQELGVISDTELEFLIDRVMLTGIPSVSLQDVKDFVQSTVFDMQEQRSGGRMMMEGSDRIH
jgi:uncharacterized protein Smg (DUF494 family)